MVLALGCADDWRAVVPALVDPAQATPISPQLPPANDWQTVTHEKLGFEIAVPGNVFQPAGTVSSEVGRVFVSRNGDAKLLIAAFDNDAQASLEEYRKHVLETSYPGAVIDYAPVRRSWFVLSGVRNDMVFYERVSFTCEGRRITSWAMIYPHAQRQYYNRVLEAVARTFRPSRTAEGGC
jgi:hypothetical protein